MKKINLFKIIEVTIFTVFSLQEVYDQSEQNSGETTQAFYFLNQIWTYIYEGGGRGQSNYYLITGIERQSFKYSQAQASMLVEPD